MKKFILPIVICATLNACGPSAAEVALREQFKADSIATAAKEELIKQQEEAERQAALHERLRELKSQLAGEQAKLASINEYHLLRTEDEKAKEVADQTLVIENLKAQIEEVNSQLNN